MARIIDSNKKKFNWKQSENIKETKKDESTRTFR